MPTFITTSRCCPSRASARGCRLGSPRRFRCRRPRRPQIRGAAGVGSTAGGSHCHAVSSNRDYFLGPSTSARPAASCFRDRHERAGLRPGTRTSHHLGETFEDSRPNHAHLPRAGSSQSLAPLSPTDPQRPPRSDRQASHTGEHHVPPTPISTSSRRPATLAPRWSLHLPRPPAGDRNISSRA